MANEIIKQAMKENHVKTWQLADWLNVSENTVYRHFRHELPEEEKQRIILLIKQEGSKHNER